jgi:hypothetical protein
MKHQFFSITSLRLQQYAIRIWRKTDHLQSGPDEEIASKIWQLERPTKTQLCLVIESMPRVFAYEILNGDGNGIYTELI